MSMETTRGEFMGELIEVRDSSIVLLVDQKLRNVPYSSIRAAKPDQTGSASVSGKSAPSAKVREQLRLRSRYPQGLSPELLKHLLEAYNQTDIEEWNP